MRRSPVGSRWLGCLALVVTLFTLGTRPAAGQGAFFSPTFGVFIPSNELVNLASGKSIALASSAATPYNA